MTSIAYAALWLFIFVLPWEGVIRIGGMAVASRATGVLAMGCTLFAVLFSARVRRLNLLHVCGILFVLTATVELFVYHSGDRLPDKLFTYIQLLLVLWMIWELAQTRQRVHGLLLAYVLGAYLASFMTVLVFRHTGGALKRFAAGGVDPNDLAMTLALALPMAWYLANIFRRPLLIWLARGYLPVGVVAIGLTGSRGGMLTTMMALTIVPLTMTRLSPKRLALMVGMLFLAGALAVVYVPEKIVQRLSTTGTEVEDLSVGGRFKLWRAGLHVFPQHPLLGFGTSGYIRATTPVVGSSAKVAHNTYLSVLVEQGVIGFTLYFMMFVAAYRGVRRLPRLERRFGIVLIGTLMLAITPLTWEDQKSTWFVLAITVAFAFARSTPLAERPVRPVQPGPPLVGRPITRRPVGPAATPSTDGT